MPEPLNGGTEPAGGNPIGASGMPVAGPPTEPVTPPVEEPAKDEDVDVDFEDLKTVPKEFQKIAKKMQSGYTKKMQALSGVEKLKADNPPVEPPAEPNPTLDEAKAKVSQYMASPEGSALKDVFESMVNDKLGTLPQEVAKQRVDREVGQVIAKYGDAVVNENYEAIEEAAKANPGIPLDYVVANVLYDKAKEIGANEYKAKITRKSDFSTTPHNSSSNVVTKREAASFDEAFEAAKTDLGF